MNFKPFASLAIATLTLFGFSACSESSETPTRSVHFSTKLAGDSACTTDLGFEVIVTTVTLSTGPLQFTVGGVGHKNTKHLQTPSSLPEQFHHPGHLQGGQVLAEYSGDHQFQFSKNSNATIQDAFTMPATHFDAVNFSFQQPEAGSISATLEGEVTINDAPQPFRIELPLDSADVVRGIPFNETIPPEGDVTVLFELYPVDPFENDTIFDGIQFDSLSTSDNYLVIDSENTGYNYVLNNVRSHDHYLFTTTSN